MPSPAAGRSRHWPCHAVCTATSPVRRPGAPAAADLRGRVRPRRRQRPVVPRAGTKSGELEIASRHKSEFLASMSHEPRTPLNAVIGFSEVLLERMFGELNDKQDEYLHDIWTRPSSAGTPQRGPRPVEGGGRADGTGPVDVLRRPALEYSLTLVRERAAAHVDHSGPGRRHRGHEIETDKLRFKQVVLNLVSNAVKFTPDGGQVTVWRTIRPGAGLTCRHRDRSSARGPGADLRVVPARRPRCTARRRAPVWG